MKQENINVNEVILHKENPRFYVGMDSYNFESVSKENFFINEPEEIYEFESAKKLISFEGDLTKFRNLIRSLSSGFNKAVDVPPFVILNKEINKYVVLEGNRRFLALKILNSNINKRIDYIGMIKELKYTEKEFDENQQNKTKVFEKNKEEIIKIINDFQNEIIEIPVNIFDLNEDKKEELESIILSRHSFVESSTNREWSRVKSIIELLMRFKSGISTHYSQENKFKNSFDLTIESLAALYNRESSKIKEDIYSAIFLKNILNINFTNGIENITDDILNIKPSALELSIDNIKSIETKTTLRRKLSIKRTKIDEIENRLIQNFEEFEVLLSDMYKITNSIFLGYDWDELSNFVMWAFKNKKLTTRRYIYCEKGLIDEEAVIKLRKIFNEEETVPEGLSCSPEFTKRQEDIFEIYKKINEKITIEDMKYDDRISTVSNSVKILESMKISEIEKFIDKTNKKESMIFSSIILSKDLKSLNETISIWSVDQMNSIAGQGNWFKKLLTYTWNQIYNSDLKQINVDSSSADYLFKPISRLALSVRALIENTILFSTYFNFEEVQANPDLNMANLWKFKNADTDNKESLKEMFDFFIDSSDRSSDGINGNVFLNTWIEKHEAYRVRNGGAFSSILKTTDEKEIFKYIQKWKSFNNSTIHKAFLIPISEGPFNPETTIKDYMHIQDFITETFDAIKRINNLYSNWVNQ